MNELVQGWLAEFDAVCVMYRHSPTHVANHLAMLGCGNPRGDWGWLFPELNPESVPAFNAAVRDILGRHGLLAKVRRVLVKDLRGPGFYGNTMGKIADKRWSREMTVNLLGRKPNPAWVIP